MDFIEFRGIKIRYKSIGNIDNEAVVLLHGYLESLDIWDGFAEKLSERYFVVCLDIPGHGESDVFSKVHRMDELAEAVHAVTDSIGLKKMHIVGHSMGGYVAMAFREAFQSSVNSCVLFHSTCLPDTKEKRENRSREIQLVKNGKKELIVNTNIPRAFADENLDIYSGEVERAKKIALKTTEKGICAILNGMKERPDRCELLLDDKIPLLIIAGKKDNYIPFEVIQNIQKKAANLEVSALEKSGHMGFIEEQKKSIIILGEFFEKHKP
ncbi:MAG: alpha/beta hydrolase [Bacteroidales bacterium]|nr:alpha/beta hydrolase [Bacteroidales bacterium]